MRVRGRPHSRHRPATRKCAYLELEPAGPHQFREHVHQHIDKPRTELVKQKQRLDLRVQIEKLQHLQRLVAQRQRPSHLDLIVAMLVGDALPLVLGPGRLLR